MRLLLPIQLILVIFMANCGREPAVARAGLPGSPRIPPPSAGVVRQPASPPVPTAPVKPPLPPQIADLPAAAALVWIAAPPDEDFYSCGEDEEDPDHPADHEPTKSLDENHRNLGARTYWVVPAGGTGAWTVVAQRPGLFVAVGDRVLEARSTRVSLELKKPPPPPVILDDGTKDDACGAPYPEGFTLAVSGSGLVLRELGGKREHPVIPTPKDYSNLQTCVMEYQWWVEPVGSLGRYLFLNHRTYTTFILSHLHLRFVVFDLARMAPVETQLLPVGDGAWRAVVDDPSWRPELHGRLKKVIRERKLELPFEPDEVDLSHLWPVFPAAGAVGLELAFRHAYDCFPCPALEVRKTIDTLPPELAAWRKRHPAVEAVTALLPKNRRVAGITVLDAPPAQAKKLLALFEAARGR